MLIEAVEKALTYRWPDGEIRLIPGQPMEVPEERARRLLEKAAGKVRMVEEPYVGAIIEYESPLYGTMRAIVVDVLPHGVKVDHPLVHEDATIPTAWIIEKEGS